MFDVSPKLAKHVSGYFFFLRLIRDLQQDPRFSENANTILVNVSVPISWLIFYWLKRKYVVIRLDGAYHDSVSYLEASNHKIFQLLGKLFPNSEFLNFTFNFFYENWKVQVRLIFCSAIVYQTEFSQQCNERLLWLTKKPSKIIPNSYTSTKRLPSGTDVAVFYSNEPRKNKDNSLRYALNYCLKNNLTLKIIGCPEKDSETLRKGFARAASDGQVQILGRYESLDELSVLLNGCGYLVFLSYRDPCPNFLLEAISLGLRPVCIASGGIPEILPSNYPMVSLSDQFGTFSPSRYSWRLPPILHEDFTRTFDKVRKIERHEVLRSDLTREAVAKRYGDFLSSL